MRKDVVGQIADAQRAIVDRLIIPGNTTSDIMRRVLLETIQAYTAELIERGLLSTVRHEGGTCSDIC